MANRDIMNLRANSFIRVVGVIRVISVTRVTKALWLWQNCGLRVHNQTTKQMIQMTTTKVVFSVGDH